VTSFDFDRITNATLIEILTDHIFRFHNSRDEGVLDYDVLPPLDDDIQLSVAEYRSKLYEVMMFADSVRTNCFVETGICDTLFCKNPHFIQLTI